MNASSNAFRSHLMQQFAASARSQARPPLALLGWLDDKEQQQRLGSGSAESFVADAPSSHLFLSTARHSPRQISSISTTPSSASSAAVSQTRAPSILSSHRRNDMNSSQNHNVRGGLTMSATKSSGRTAPPAPIARSGSPHRHLSVPALDHEEEGEQLEVDHLAECSPAETSDGVPEDLELPERFQNLLQTRRTSNKFAVLPPMTANDATSFWKGALERAVICGCSAPNHKRTEPFTFKRMIAPSAKTERLADIAYHVHAQKQRQKKSYSKEQEESILSSAQRKREKWLSIPAFLVTTVSSPDTFMGYPEAADSDEGHVDPHAPLPYVPPSSERALEDYASACAAVQNCLLSLHAESLATKWATGPVIRTPAFRELVQATPEERVVALIMVGRPPENSSSRISDGARRRMRRQLHGDVLVDL